MKLVPVASKKSYLAVLKMFGLDREQMHSDPVMFRYNWKGCSSKQKELLKTMKITNFYSTKSISCVSLASIIIRAFVFKSRYISLSSIQKYKNEKQETD